MPAKYQEKGQENKKVRTDRLQKGETLWLILFSKMAVTVSPIHVLFLKCDTDIPPTESWGLHSLPWNPGGPVSAAEETLCDSRGR